jgi:cell division protease FtsH
VRSRSSSYRGLRFLLGTLLALIVTFVLLLQSTYRAPAPGREVDFSELVGMAAEGMVVRATLLDEDARILGTFCRPRPGARAAATPEACESPLQEFHADYPRSDVATQQLIENIVRGGAPLSIDNQNGKAVAKLLLTFIFPLALLANLFGLIFMSRSGDSSLASITGFSKLGRRQKRKSAPTADVTFADVAGVEEALVELREVIDYLVNPTKFEAYQAAAPKGVLLFGPPGCGKTLLARAVAGESGVPFFSVSGTEFVESLVGVGAARVRDLFRQVSEVAPAIVFIDELDALGRRREGEGMSGGEREQTLNQLLVEMDGFQVTAGIVLIGATNRPDILDPALLRPGRFDRHITLTAPDVNGRKAILEVHARSKPMAADVDFDALARRTSGFTGADLANVINEAALLTIRSEGGQITAAHVSEAIQRVLHGPHRGSIMSPDERRRLACHEAGHALLMAAFGRADQLSRVSILGRGQGLGRTSVTGDSDRALLTFEDMEAELTITMGGLSAEQLVLGRASSAAEDDIEKATSMAREMVGLYGMSDQIGRVRLISKYAGYLGTEVNFESVSERTMQQFEDEVKRLITTAEHRAAAVLRHQRREFEALALRLQEEEALEDTALKPLLASVAVRTDLLQNGSPPAPSRRSAATTRASTARPRTRTEA